MGLFEEVVEKTTYSRWLPEKKRREDWKEVIRRYVEYLEKRNGQPLPQRELIIEKLEKKEIVPSMRLLFSAGASPDCDVSAYNCYFTPICDLKCFAEAFYILLRGTGVGYSVEEKLIAQLPRLARRTYREVEVVFEDNTQSWAEGVLKCLEAFFAGNDVVYNTERVRKRGEIIKTFGGRAAGPEVLVKSLEAIKIRIFDHRKWTENPSAHLVSDIMCLLSEIVQVGGVRRSALICLFDQDSMMTYKSNEWWKENPQRRMANVSRVYTRKPELTNFMRNWSSLIESRSGEPGLFNREAAEDKCRSIGRSVVSWMGTNPCGEIILRSFQFCNLTEVVIREGQTWREIKKLTELVTILGTFQSSLTNFSPFLRPEVTKNTVEERLLGCSFTGIYGNQLMHNMGEGKEIRENLMEPHSLQNRLTHLKGIAKKTNEETAKMLGRKPSAAIGCVKPSGNTSSLVGTSAGMHAWHSRFYKRAKGISASDPVAQCLIHQGVPYEVDKFDEGRLLFYFPVEAKGIVKDQVSVDSHMALWFIYRNYWCDHNPSVTVSVGEDEWLKVADWIYQRWYSICGMSFLPKDDHVYEQAPYTEIGSEEYKLLREKMDKIEKSFNWQLLEMFENEDNTTGNQEYACTAGQCERI